MGETNNSGGEVTTLTEEEGKTPKTERTLTPEVEALAARANATLTNAGRLEAELRRSQGIADSAISKLRAIEERELQREEADASGDPVKTNALSMKREALRIQADTDDKLRKMESKEAELQAREQGILRNQADRLAERYNVDATFLLKYGTDEGSLNELAKGFPERTPAGEPDVVRMKDAPDSGKTKGGGTKLTRSSVEGYSTDGKTTKQIMEDAKEVLDQFTKGG